MNIINIIMNFLGRNLRKITTTIVMFAAFIFIAGFFIRSMKNSVSGETLTFENVTGDVKYIRGDKEKIIENGSEATCGGTFYVGKDSGVTIIVDESKKIELKENSVMEVTAKNSIDGGNTPDALMNGSNITVKSYNVTLSKGEAIVDIIDVKNNAYFMVSTPDVSFYAEASKIDVSFNEATQATYVTAERGNVEIKKSTTRNVNEGSSVYIKDGAVRDCVTMTLEKKDTYLFSYIKPVMQEYYEVYSGDKVAESNVLYTYYGDDVMVDDLELAQKVYDIFDEIYIGAENGETTIDIKSPDGETMTVHIIKFENGIITFDPVDSESIYKVVCRL